MVVVEVASFAGGPATRLGQTYGVANINADSGRRIIVASARLSRKVDNFDVTSIASPPPYDAQ